MARSRKVEDALEALAELRRQPLSDATTASLRAALATKLSPVVAKAARIAGDLEIADLVPDLRGAFHRLLENPVKSDPGCAAKTEIASALYRMGAYEDALFLRGIRHVQREPVWGGTEDTACDLRSACAHALIRLNHPDAANEIAELLADHEAMARVGAARAIAYSELDRFAPLLRLKILAGDEPQVTGECVLALLRIAPAASLEFCARLLEGGDPQRSESTALALGESRLRSALPLLRAWWQGSAQTRAAAHGPARDRHAALRRGAGLPALGDRGSAGSGRARRDRSARHLPRRRGAPAAGDRHRRGARRRRSRRRARDADRQQRALSASPSGEAVAHVPRDHALLVGRHDPHHARAGRVADQRRVPGVCRGVEHDAEVGEPGADRARAPLPRARRCRR